MHVKCLHGKILNFSDIKIQNVKIYWNNFIINVNLIQLIIIEREKKTYSFNTFKEIFNMTIDDNENDCTLYITMSKTKGFQKIGHLK